MQTQLNIPTVARKSGQSIAGRQTETLLRVGETHGWNFPILGYAEPPKEIVRLRKWMIVPAHMDSSPLPQEAQRRLQALFAAGERPKALLIAHETSMLLTAPKDPRAPVAEVARERFQVNKEKVETMAGTSMPALQSAAKVLVIATIATAVIASLGPILILLGLVAGAAALDPVLIWVTEDNAFVEIYRWNVE